MASALSLLHSGAHAPTRSILFSRKMLHTTERLLHANHPQLAHKIAEAMLSHNISYTRPNTTLANLPFPELTQCLGASLVSQIIAALTDIGQCWLTRSKYLDIAPETLKELLIEWIALGEWIVQHTDHFRK